jgi:RNA polymerase sigma-70 factor (ECF subfamily)
MVEADQRINAARTEGFVDGVKAGLDREQEGAVVAAVRAGDASAFGKLVEPYRRELHVHCYRLLGSFEEAEHKVQETLAMAWRRRETFQARSTFRAWLYRMATETCLDTLERTSRRVPSPRSLAEIPWIQPYPDRLLDELASGETSPETVVVTRETIELGFLATIQLLTAQQRAVLIMRDVLHWSAGETAGLLSTSVAAANSALQRARATLRERMPASRLDWFGARPSQEEASLLQRYIAALEAADVAALDAVLADDIRVTEPPHPMCYDGRDAVAPWFTRAVDAAHGALRLVPVGANRQPAAANFLRRPGDSGFRAWRLDVLRVRRGAIAEITSFDASLFGAFGLPTTL